MNARTGLAPLSFGLSEQFQMGDYRRVENLLKRLEQVGAMAVRTPIEPKEYQTAAGRAWYEWLVPALATRFELLPCFDCPVDITDDHAAAERRTHFIGTVLEAFGAYFSAAELRIAPQAMERDPRLDPSGARFVDALGNSIQRLREAGKRVVLSGPFHAGWLELLGARGLLREVDAIGLQGHPSRGELGGLYWPRRIGSTREVLGRYGSTAEIWITHTGFANDGTHDRAQIRAFVETMDAPAERFYWHSAQDSAHEEQEAFGLFDRKGEPRLLARLLPEGPARLRELLALSQRGRRHNGKGVALITGGGGFIGTNLAARLLGEGRNVRIFDNLSRAGTERNLRWLTEQHGDKLEFRLADVRDRRALREAIADATEVYHFAAQVAVTTSLVDPLHDFEINGRGTLNLLEELRQLDKPPALLFTSTNKVYGGLDDLPLSVNDTRYDLADPELRARGIDESRPLTFCSPYGCSKGASDQYVLDFARTFHLPAAVLRMSCIYGPHQFGTEDQGWVAHFARQALAREPIVVYGDGRQVRDILFVEDLIEAMLLARDRMDALRGQAFNIGGGPRNSVSLRELIGELGRLGGSAPEVRYESWRASDQRYYVSDVSRFHAATGWSPRTSIQEGLERMTEWMLTERSATLPPEAGRVAL